MANKRRQFKLLEFKDGDPVVARVDEFLGEIGKGHRIHMVNRLLAIGYLEYPELVDDASHADQRTSDKIIRKYRMRLNLADPYEADLDQVFSQIKQRQVDALFTRLVVSGYQALYQSHRRLARPAETPATESKQWESNDNIADTQPEPQQQADNSANIIVCHSKREDVGKSLVAALLVDYYIENEYPVALIEGDDSSDVALRYENQIQTQRIDFDRAAERKQVVRQFIDAVNQLASSDENKIIVVNLSSSASETLDAIAHDLVAATTSAGHSCSLIHSLGQQKATTSSIRQSFQSGLAGVLGTDRVVIAYYIPDGERDIRDEIGLDCQEVEIPNLIPPEIAEKVLEIKFEHPLSELAREDCGELKTMERIMFQKKWLTPAHDAIASVVPALTSTVRQDKA